jgi:hypothetical protein
MPREGTHEEAWILPPNGAPLGQVLEARLDRVERQLDGMERSIADVREWLAFREGRERPSLWTPRSLS